MQSKLTPEIRNYIKKNIKESNRELEKLILKEFQIKASHTIIGRFKRKHLETPKKPMETKKVFPVGKMETPKKIVTKLPKISKPKKSQKPRLTLNRFLEWLDYNAFPSGNNAVMIRDRYSFRNSSVKNIFDIILLLQEEFEL